MMGVSMGHHCLQINLICGPAALLDCYPQTVAAPINLVVTVRWIDSM